MSIVKATPLAFVNAKMKRAETDLDVIIKQCLDDMADERLLVGSATTGDGNIVALASGTKTIPYPNLYLDMISIKLNNGTKDFEPLRAIPGGMREYRQWMDGETAADYTTPEYYTEFNGNFYIYHTANGAYTPTIEFYKYHQALASGIEFGDEFLNCINYGTTFFYALSKNNTRYIEIWGPMYENEKAKRKANMPAEVYICG